MSEPLLNAIIQLFAIVAKEDNVTQQERDQIEAFLIENLNQKGVNKYLKVFDGYSDSIIIDETVDREEEHRRISSICAEINKEFTQKQKVVIILELISIILADGRISEREDELVQIIGNEFNVARGEIDLIKSFVTGKSPADYNSDAILIIDSNNYSKLDFNHIFRANIQGFICLLHLSKADAYFVKFLGSSNVYLNGAPLQSGRKTVFAIGATLRPERSDPVYYGDIIRHFITTDEDNQLSFEARNISYHFKNGKPGLREINIAEGSGRLIGLMGASGAGKSTLLNVLNGHDVPSNGEVLINGINMHAQPDRVEGVIGFVPQDDLLIEELTVHQNLFYAAKLCFDNLSEGEIEGLVSKTLDNLGLMETRGLYVGSPLDKTISGGQRKRLNIGLELLREPTIMFVDEPTSGLSSRDSENIMDLLKELSLKGKLIFVVIHQPSSDIFKMFDKLIILDTGGYQIYYGNPVEAVVYFKEIINLINSEQGECIECGNVNPEQIFNIIETRVVNEYGNFTSERKILPEQWHGYFKRKTELPKVKENNSSPKTTLNIPNKFKQLLLFTRRDLLSKLHNKQYLFINLLEAPVLAFILAYIVRYYNTYDSTHGSYVFGENVNIPAYFFMSIIVALFMGLTVSAEEIIRDRKIKKREAFLHLSRGSYICSKLLILFTLSGIQTFTFVVIGNLVLEIKDMLLIHWLILFTTSCMANTLGLNISSAFNSAVTIYILIPILLIPQLVLSGVVVKFDQLNPGLTSAGEVPLVGDMMTSRWAFEASMVAQFRDNEYEGPFYTYEKVMAISDYKKLYYIPALESKLEYHINNMDSRDEAVNTTKKANLILLKNELKKELRKYDNIEFDQMDNLTIEKFDSAVYRKTYHFLEQLRSFYATRYNRADRAKDKIVVSMTRTKEQREKFEQFKIHYRNEAIAGIVKNQSEQHRIIEKDGHLLQKIFPIYKEPVPSGFLDYRTQFYVPEKYFAGVYFDTVIFNLMIIWVMSIVLIVCLYYEVLRKVILGLEKPFKKN